MATESSIRQIEVQRRASATLAVVVGILASLSLSSCQDISGEPSTPTPTPTAIPFDELYRILQSESELNSVRLKEKEGRWFRFRGQVTDITDRKIRFYVGPPKPLAYDCYVECNFDSNEQITGMNEGQDVALLGRLVRAFRGRFLFDIGETEALVFEDCLVSEVY